jgi:hypothetical protein
VFPEITVVFPKFDSKSIGLLLAFKGARFTGGSTRTENSNFESVMEEQ